jgi:outer membrane receptor protein involved in Fe transport
MSRMSFRDYLLATSVFGTALVALPAAAQQTDAAPPVAGTPSGTNTGSIGPVVTPQAGTTDAEGNDAPAGGGDIVVTGSRISNPNLTSPSPLTVIGSQEVKLQGTTRVEDLVNSLPQVFAGQGGGVSNGSTGTATVDLRGLGPQRTLVLLNGRRLTPGDPRSPVADLNQIPAALIERVEVLTGGASSVYGSDAISGVVNFVMDTNFEGFRLDGQYSFFQHENNGDQRAINALNARNFGYPTGNTASGGTVDSTLTFGAGTADGKGHVTAYAGYRRVNSVLQSQYDYSSCALAASTAADTFSCSGSGTTAPAQFQFFNNNFGNGTTQTLNPAVANGAGFRPYSAARDAFNFAPYNYYQRPDERFTLGAFANYKISDAVEPYLELSFMDDRTNAQIAPSGAFGVQYLIPCDGSNPLLSAAQLTTACAGRTGVVADDPATPINEANSISAVVLRRNVEGGGRQDDLRHTNYRIVAGLRGDVGGGFRYDAYAQFGRSVFSQTYLNDFSISRLQRSLDVVNRNGTATCRSVVDGSDPLCVPYNIYTLNGVTPEALSYLQTPGFSNGQTTEQVASASLTNSDIGIKSPFADSGLGFSIGAEYRKESIEFRTDTAFTTGDLAGQGGPTIGLVGEPSFDVAEVFGELLLPLVTDKPFFNELSVNLGYRYSDYSSIGSTDAYKAEGIWSPFSAVKIRGGYNRAVRAPNIVELFTPQGQSLFAGVDPCAGTAPTASLAACQRTGVTAGQYGNVPENPAAQLNQITGGNPNLDPETADTYTGGVVIAPEGGFLRGFSLSVDYFDIRVKDTVSSLGSQVVLNQCLQTGAQALCGLINRDATGSLFLLGGAAAGAISNTNVNIGSLRTKGIDVAANYRIPLGSDLAVAFSFVGTYLMDLKVNPGIVDAATGVSSYDCAKKFGVTCGIPNPEWRHKLRTTFSLPGNVSLSANWRYIGKVTDEQQSDNPFLAGSNFIANRRIKAYNLFDLAVLAPVADAFTLRAGVNNIFDRDPPLIGQGSLSGTFGNGNTYPQVYDALGRYIYAGFSINF